MAVFSTLRGPVCARSSRLVLLCALLAVAGLLPGVATAAPENGTLVVEGRGGTTTEWVLKDNASVRAEQVELAGGGAFAGVLIEPLDHPYSFSLGALQVRAFNDATRDAVAILGPDGQLEPGRYRVTLFGQGFVSVRYPMGDAAAPGLRVVPRTPTRVSFLGRAESLDMGRDSARVELPGALPAGRRAIQVSLTEGLEVGQREMCATGSSVCEDPVVPQCLPSPAPCDVLPVSRPGAGVSTGEPQLIARLHRPQPDKRTLLWTVDVHRDTAGKLRAAALVF